MLVPFEPAVPPSTNGNGARRRARREQPLRGVGLGFVAGGLIAANTLSIEDWSDPVRASWGWFLLAGAVAGGVAAALRRSSARASGRAGGIAAILTLWGIYGLAHARGLSPSPRTGASRVAVDLLVLTAFALASGPFVALLVARGMARRGRGRSTSRGGR